MPTNEPSTPLTVQAVLDGRTVQLNDGTKMQVEGLAPPGECWAQASAEFAGSLLIGKTVRVNRGQPVSPLKLDDGTDYALLAVGQGAARAEAPKDVLLEAQNAAQGVPSGLWGAPCNGNDAKPTSSTPPPPPPPPPAPPKTTPKPPPPVFFLTCDDARRAGAAPIPIGQPGYRFQLDENRNGLACD